MYPQLDDAMQLRLNEINEINNNVLSKIRGRRNNK